MMPMITSSGRLPLALVLVGLTAMPLWAQGGTVKGQIDHPGWAGTWQDQDRSIVHLREGGSNGRILDLDGKDRASIFHATCIVTQQSADGQPSKAECAGAGINHAEGFRFIYRNSLTLNANQLQETWEAQHVGGVIKGSAVFTPVVARPR